MPVENVAMSGFDRIMAGLAVRASCRAYSIGKLDPGMLEDPGCGSVGFTAAPEEIVGGPLDVDAVLVGTTASTVVVAFRGTLAPTLQPKTWDEFWEIVKDWLNDTNAILIGDGYPGKVHKGFAESLDNLWGRLLHAVQKHVAGGKPVLVTGHSKGGALATLAAIRLATAEIAKPLVFTFGSPRTGDSQFAAAYNQTVTMHWRIENQDDLVPHLPPSPFLIKILAARDSRLKDLKSRGYSHVGTLEFYNWNGKFQEDNSGSFGLETERRLHLLALAPLGQVNELWEDHFIQTGYLAHVQGG